MGRTKRRHATGWIVLEKRTAPYTWVAHWYSDESYQDAAGRTRYKQRSHILGFKTKDDLPTRGAAQKKWDSECPEVMQGLRKSPTTKIPDHTLHSFLNEGFIPIRGARWNKATRTKLSYYFNLMCGEFGLVPLSEIEKRGLQRFLNRLAERLCHDTVNGCYIYLKAIFAEAVEQKLVLEDPTKTLALPRTRERDTFTVSLEDVQRLEEALEGRDRVIFKLLSRCGPRAGETFGFQWGDQSPIRRFEFRGPIPEAN